MQIFYFFQGFELLNTRSDFPILKKGEGDMILACDCSIWKDMFVSGFAIFVEATLWGTYIKKRNMSFHIWKVRILNLQLGSEFMV